MVNSSTVPVNAVICYDPLYCSTGHHCTLSVKLADLAGDAHWSDVNVINIMYNDTDAKAANQH